MRLRTYAGLVVLCILLGACDAVYRADITNSTDQSLTARLYDGERFRMDRGMYQGTPIPIRETRLEPGQTWPLEMIVGGGGTRKVVVDAWTATGELVFCTLVAIPTRPRAGPQTPTPLAVRVQITDGRIDCPGAPDNSRP